MLESFDRAHPAPVTVSCVLQSPEVYVSRIILSSLVVPLTESIVKAVLKSVLMGLPWASLVVVAVVPILCECRTTESQCCSNCQSHRKDCPSRKSFHHVPPPERVIYEWHLNKPSLPFFVSIRIRGNVVRSLNSEG